MSPFGLSSALLAGVEPRPIACQVQERTGPAPFEDVAPTFRQEERSLPETGVLRDLNGHHVIPLQCFFEEAAVRRDDVVHREKYVGKDEALCKGSLTHVVVMSVPDGYTRAQRR